MGRDLRRLDDRAALSAQDALCGNRGRRHRLELRHLGIERRAALPLQSEADAKRRARSGDSRRGYARWSRQGGVAEFTKPQPQTLKLEPGVLFPSAHTIVLIDAARRGENFVTRQVFDGATDENAVQVSAAIGLKVTPAPVAANRHALLDRPGWRVRLAFFPVDASAEKPDYELGMRLLDNGVSEDMLIDYGEYSIHAKLDDIEALSKPSC